MDNKAADGIAVGGFMIVSENHRLNRWLRISFQRSLASPFGRGVTALP